MSGYDNKKTYLGDGVYAELDSSETMIMVYTDNGVERSEPIYLEYEVYQALVQFGKRVWLPEPPASGAV